MNFIFVYFKFQRLFSALSNNVKQKTLFQYLSYGHTYVGKKYYFRLPLFSISLSSIRIPYQPGPVEGTICEEVLKQSVHPLQAQRQ